MKDRIDVSHEMTTFVGHGAVPAGALPQESAVFFFEGFGDGNSPVLGYRQNGELDDLADMPLIFVVQRAACRRIFGFEPHQDNGRWHLPNALRSLALSLIACEARGEALTTLRLARSIELLCQVHALLGVGQLIPIAGEGRLSELDAARLANARRIIDQRWNEKLTISELARLAGINRDKLVRGFRELYDTSVADLLSERRLAEARRLLLATDLPVASVGYRCSYLNNASFTRAFTRHFGVAPSAMRRHGVAA